MKIIDLIRFLEAEAPPVLQESYDNSGLICGDANAEIASALVSLDCTEEVVLEAKAKGCGLIISHHPILFKGIKRLTGSNYVERTLLLAIKNDIAIYAIHTNLDHVQHGVNAMICEKLGLTNTRILAPKDNVLLKLGVYVPQSNAEDLRNALFAAGAGEIGNYSECSFNLEGTGTFKAEEKANPTLGERGVRHSEKETRVEVILPFWLQVPVLNAMRGNHPYEEIAFDLVQMKNHLQTVGSGMIGELEEFCDELIFLQRVKEVMKAGVVRYTKFRGKKIKKVAVCGGSGSFLLPDAIRSGADVYVSADFKYHEFFDAEGKILIADIGHFESEQFTLDLLVNWITKKFPTFAVHFTDTNTNPINYL